MPWRRCGGCARVRRASSREPPPPPLCRLPDMRSFLILGHCAAVVMGASDLTMPDNAAAVKVVRRALQATAESICGTVASISTSTGTLYDDQPNIDSNPSVDCTTGACNGPDGSCFGGLCVHGTNGYGDNLDCGKQLVAPLGSTIMLTFSQIALETAPSCSQTTSDGADDACDYITIYDGPDSHSPVLGSFSGTQVSQPAVTSGRYAFVRFQTDTGNAGLSNTHLDPGFFLDWTFVQNIAAGSGVAQADGSYGICPAADVLTAAHGTIHDDQDAGLDCTQPNSHCGSTANAGYQDNLNCYTTIQAPTGSVVQLTFTQLNLEGPGQVVGCQPCTDPRGCDWIAIYDGVNTSAPLINTYSGTYINTATGSTLPSVVSSGQNMHIVFRTDNHNCGITSNEDPG
jgi:hypothetical protein